MLIPIKTTIMKSLLTTSLTCLFAIFSLSIASAGDTEKKELDQEEVSVIESGTYKVTAHIVDDEEKEIYVKMEDGKILELYIKKDTKLRKGDEKIDFSAFKKGQALEIEIEKHGDHMKPVSVEILKK